MANMDTILGKVLQIVNLPIAPMGKKPFEAP
jgi:hypothetical protein